MRSLVSDNALVPGTGRQGANIWRILTKMASVNDANNSAGIDWKLITHLLSIEGTDWSNAHDAKVTQQRVPVGDNTLYNLFVMRQHVFTMLFSTEKTDAWFKAKQYLRCVNSFWWHWKNCTCDKAYAQFFRAFEQINTSVRLQNYIIDNPKGMAAAVWIEQKIYQ